MERRQAHDKNVRWLWKEPQMQHNNTTWSTSRIEINEQEWGKLQGKKEGRWRGEEGNEILCDTRQLFHVEFDRQAPTVAR